MSENEILINNLPNLPVYVATDAFLAELRELGYISNIELDDFIDFLEEDPAYIEQMEKTLCFYDEVTLLSPLAASFLHNLTADFRRPT
jgi:hypothetical protein